MLLSLKALLFLELLLAIGLFAFRWALEPKLRKTVGVREIGVTVLLPAVYFAIPNPYVIEGCLALLVAFVGRTRTDVAGIYCLLLPITPAFSIETSAGGAYLLAFSTMVAAGFGGLIGMLLRPRRGRWAVPSFDSAAIALLLLFTFMQSRDGNATMVLRAFISNVLELGAPYFIVSRAIGSERDVCNVLTRLYLATFLAAGVSLFEVLRHWSLYEEASMHMGLSHLGTSYLNLRAGLMRASGAMMNSSVLGLFLAVMAVGLVGVRSYFHKYGRWLVVVVVLLGLIAAQSRGAWLGAVAGYVVVCLYRGYNRGYILMVLAATLYAVSSMLSRSGRLAETLGNTGAAAETSEYRRLLFEAGIQQVRSHLLLGQSAPRLIANLPELVQGQGIVDFVNSHLYVAMAAGIVGFIMWGGVWILPLLVIWRNRSIARVRGVGAMLVIPVGFISASVVALTFTSMGRTIVWPTIGLALAGPLLKLAKVRKRRSFEANT